MLKGKDYRVIIFILAFFLVSTFLFFVEIDQVFSINKTVSWQWEMINILFWLSMPFALAVVMLLVVLFLMTLKKH